MCNSDVTKIKLKWQVKEPKGAWKVRKGWDQGLSLGVLHELAE